MKKKEKMQFNCMPVKYYEWVVYIPFKVFMFKLFRIKRWNFYVFADVGKMVMETSEYQVVCIAGLIFSKEYTFYYIIWYLRQKFPIFSF